MMIEERPNTGKIKKNYQYFCKNIKIIKLNNYNYIISVY